MFHHRRSALECRPKRLATLRGVHIRLREDPSPPLSAKAAFIHVTASAGDFNIYSGNQLLILLFLQSRLSLGASLLQLGHRHLLAATRIRSQSGSCLAGTHRCCCQSS